MVKKQMAPKHMTKQFVSYHIMQFPKMKLLWQNILKQNLQQKSEKTLRNTRPFIVYTNENLIFDKKKNRKSSIKWSSLQFYGMIIFVKTNPSAEEWNGKTAIPKMMVLQYTLSCVP